MSVELSNISKSFGALEVIKDVSINVASGEFVVFVGPSGCGKSTLLRLIAGLETLTSGQLMIAGQDVSALPAARRGIAMVFQSYALYPHLSVFENMAFGLRIAKMANAEIMQKVRAAAEVLQLTEHLDRLPKVLSGGQRQRVAIGRAIVRQPHAFLFDEPLSNLDAALRADMRVELAELHRKLGATIIYVTHDQVEAMTLADRIVMLNAGRVEQIGPPMELYLKPQTPFVAGFIGSPKMNFLEGSVAQAAGADLCGIRPEHFLVAKGPADIKGRIRYLEMLGSDTLIYVDTAEYGPLRVRQAGIFQVAVGATIDLSFQPDHLHFFKNNRRIAV